ncbi:MAG: AAA family ATPase [Rubrivivax sp.]|nr:AAA family ATPase [Rubrivivax sp.]MDH5339679.1 AAA family ATPase [Rubrivivax sp.]
MNARTDRSLAQGVSWPEQNQAWLAAELARLRLLVEARLASGGQDAAFAAATPAALATPWIGPADAPPALERVAQLFELSSFERDLLLLACGQELDPHLRSLLPEGISFSLAVSLLDAPHWDALSPLAPLRHWQLLSLPASAPPASAPILIDERVLHAVTGVVAFDERLIGIARPARGSATADQPLAVLIAKALRAPLPPLLMLAAQGAASLAVCRDSAVAAVQSLGDSALLIDAADLPGDPAELDLLARRLDREAALSRATLVVWGEAPTDAQRRLFALVDRLRSAVVLAGEVDGARLRDRVQRHVTRLQLPPKETTAAATPAALRSALQQFHVDAATLREAMSDAAAAAPGASVDPQVLWQSLRHAARGGLDTLAQRLETDTRFDDLVLPPAPLAQLQAIATQLRHRHTVHEDWGFARRGTRGLGLAALFSGESGTGKTMAAEAIAHEAGLDLYRIDLASTVSKYIGETEKNLARLFDAAQASGAVLLFDEADALFGKRSEVKDSHDRYANIEIAYLLQRVESYRGLAILTSNLKSSLDKAFLRRIRFIVQFPFPDESLRARLWRCQLPEAAPRGELDWTALARAPLSGGHIRAAALQAAFAAAAAARPIDQALLMQAVHAEFAKLERPWSGGGGT